MDPKKAALESFARVLANKGQPAQAHAELSREFLERISDFKDKVLTLKCTDPMAAGMVADGRAALDGVWCPPARFADYALSTLSKKIIRHAESER